MTSVYEKALNHCIKETYFTNFKKNKGKVRDVFDLDKRLLMVSTDRLSAFDRFVTTIPFKGQVLNSISQYWFEKTRHLVKNHMLACPYSNAMMVKKVKVFPIEFVVRGYLTGSTSTSIWTLYQQGERRFGDFRLKEGMKKNDKLPEPILTPTTKDLAHDRPINKHDILQAGLMSEDDYLQVEEIALSIYDFANTELIDRDLILVDTKMEFGKDEHGNIILVDELLTPDSSRYWRNSNFMTLQEKGLEPDNFDKEKIRLWLKTVCSPYEDETLPEVPEKLIIDIAKTYVSLFEMITKMPFNFEAPTFRGELQLISEEA